VWCDFEPKQITKLKLLFFKFLYKIKNQFELTRFGFFFFKLIQIKIILIELFFGLFHWPYFSGFMFLSCFYFLNSVSIFRDIDILAFLFSQLCAYFPRYRHFDFLNKHDSFLNLLNMHDIKKFNFNFLFVRSLLKN